MLCRDSGEDARFCRIECVAGMHGYALACMLTHGSANPVVFPQRLRRSLVVYPEGSLPSICLRRLRSLSGCLRTDPSVIAGG